MTRNTINDDMTMAGGESSLLAHRYRIMRQLGQGGMGSVWLAEDTLLDGKPFAIKMLPSILVSNKRAYRQLKDEALVAMKLTHPNIVTLRAFEENNGNPFLVMDYIDGETLDDYLAEHSSRVERVDRVEVGDGRGMRPAYPLGGLPEAEAIRILKPIAEALDYAHGEGVVHRDVKPANVMIRKDGHPFILDFGIAREIQETLTRVTGKFSSGTLLYMSPEQLRGQPPKAAQDIYSFAAMAYECLKGESPFVRGQIEYQILNEEPSPLCSATLQRGCAQIDSLAAGVMAGLAKKPEDRPQSCVAVLGEQSICHDGDGLVERNSDLEGVRAPQSHDNLAYAQADCIRLMADAKVAQRHLARFSENPAYRQELRAIEDDFVRADAIRVERQWALAAECYARIIKRGKAIEEADARRIAEENARCETAEKARGEASDHVRREREEESRLEAEIRARRAMEEIQKHRVEDENRRAGDKLPEKFVFTSHAEFVVTGLVYVLIFVGVLSLMFLVGTNWDMDRIWDVIRLILRR